MRKDPPFSTASISCHPPAVPQARREVRVFQPSGVIARAPGEASVLRFRLSLKRRWSRAAPRGGARLPRRAARHHPGNRSTAWAACGHLSRLTTAWSSIIRTTNQDGRVADGAEVPARDRARRQAHPGHRQRPVPVIASARIPQGDEIPRGGFREVGGKRSVYATLRHATAEGSRQSNLASRSLPAACCWGWT